MNSENGGLLTDTERAHVDKRLDLFNEESLIDGDELLLASAVHRSHHTRDVLVMTSLGMSGLALAVAVVVGSLATNDYVALLLIGYLVLAGLLCILTRVAIARAVTAEAVRVIVVHRIDRRESRAQADADRRAADASRANRKRPFLRGVLGLA